MTYDLGRTDDYEAELHKRIRDILDWTGSQVFSEEPGCGIEDCDRPGVYWYVQSPHFKRDITRVYDEEGQLHAIAKAGKAIHNTGQVTGAGALSQPQPHP